jgi:hypothetical protein
MRWSNRERRVRRFLDSDELRKAHRSIERELDRVREPWGLRGWSIVGTGSRVRLQVHVDVMIERPQTAASTITLPASIGGGDLKVSVMATHAHLPRRSAAPGPNGHLHPGAPIRAVSGGIGQRIGAAAFAVDDDGIVYLLTCGHGVSAGGHIEVSDERVADVTLNALHSDGVDAALCKLTPHGLELANDSAESPAWFTRLHRPSVDDNNKDVKFLPTNGSATPPFTERVLSFSAAEQVGGFWLRGLITLPECTVDGDSGSLLVREDKYYGLCTGSSGALSCFTPIASALTLFRTTLKGLHLWTPDIG